MHQNGGLFKVLGRFDAFVSVVSYDLRVGRAPSATSIDLALERAIAAAVHTKERVVARYGVGSDVHPTVALWSVGIELANVVIGAGPDRGYDALTLAVAAFPADMVVVTVESFVLTAPGADLSVVGGPSPRERFAAGDPDVAECVWVTAYSPDDTASGVWLPYRYAGRSVEWLDRVDGEELGIEVMFGETPDAVYRGYAQQAPLPRHEAVALLEELDCMVALGNGPRVERNATCPCGSGRKYKHCHGR